MKRTAILLAGVVLLLFACAPRPSELTSAVAKDQATAMAMHALMEGFNQGSYEAWSRDWSDAMRGAIGENAFLAFRAQALDQVGEFRTIREARLVPGQNPGYVRWEFVCDFDKQPMILAYGFKHDGTEVEGVFFNAPATPEG